VSDEFPGYVVHFTDFSPNRKDALSRELRASNSKQQIEQLWDALKADNIKAGWIPQGSSVAAPATQPAAPAETAEAAPTRKATRKTATKPEAAEITDDSAEPAGKTRKKATKKEEPASDPAAAEATRKPRKKKAE
jgi:hypothetical protein